MTVVALVVASPSAFWVVAAPPAAAPPSSFMSLVREVDRLKQEGLYDAALQRLREGRRRLGADTQANEASALLYRMEASLLECTAQPLQAIAAFGRALHADPTGGAGVESWFQHVNLLRRLVATPTALSGAQGERALQGAAHLLHNRTAQLIMYGPWRHPQQLPRQYLPHLPSRPWMSVAAPLPNLPLPRLAAVVARLEAATQQLVAEYGTLKAAGLLHAERECIHDPRQGDWSVLTAWQRGMEAATTTATVDHTGRALPEGYGPTVSDCNDTRTPVTCALLRDVDGALLSEDEGPAIRFHPVRAGFSAIAGGTHLYPHCGQTNAQWKLHLGLITPNGTAGPCARMRVGNTTRAWKAGKALLFDDSWEHEVWNDCGGPAAPTSPQPAEPVAGGMEQAGESHPVPDAHHHEWSTRVVFQLVFRHPLLGGA